MILIDRIAEQVVRRRFVVLIVLSVVTLSAGLLAAGIQFDFTPQSLYDGHEELIAYADQFHAEFPTDDLALLIVTEATGEEDVLAPPLLAWQRELAKSLLQQEAVIRVDSPATLRLPRPRLFPPFFFVAPVVAEDPPSSEDAQRLRDVLNDYRVFDRVLIGPERRVSAALAFLKGDSREIEDMQQVVGSAESLLQKLPPPDGYRVHLTGLPAFRVAVVRDLQKEQTSQVPFVGILFVLLLAWVFRSTAGIIMPLVAVGSAVGWTVGIMSMLGLKFNLITNVLPVLLLVIGISNCVHFVSRYFEECARQNGNRLAAARSTVSHMSVACFLTCLTTALGFLSLCFAQSDVLREFGSEAALGMCLLFVSTVLWLGAALPLFRASRAEDIGAVEDSRMARRVASIGATAAARPRQTLLLALAGVVAIAVTQSLDVDSRIIETYEEGHPVQQTLQVIENHLSGVTSLEVSLTANEPGGLFEPDNFRRIAQFVAYLQEQEEVLRVHSYVDVFQQIYRQMRRSDPYRDQLPTNDEAGEKRIAMARRLARKLAGSMQYRSLMSANETRARIICRIRDVGSRRTLELINRCEDGLSAAFPAETGIQARLTGEAYLHAHSMDLLIRDVFFSLCGASALIFVIIGVLFRSVRIGLITIVPNLTPLIVTLGYMNWRGYEMNVGNVIVFAVSIGIAVDDTIHFLARFREELHGGRSPAEAVHHTLLSAGRAIVLTSVIVVLGLSVMFWSEFMPTRRFAELMSVTMMAALLGDLVLLPACVAVMWPQRKQER